MRSKPSHSRRRLGESPGTIQTTLGLVDLRRPGLEQAAIWVGAQFTRVDVSDCAGRLGIPAR
jgi:hypothetical protein